jgi:hypothetical protein
MESDVDDIERPLDEEDAAEEQDLDDLEPTEDDLANTEPPPDPAAAGDAESIQDLLVKQEARADEEEAEEEDEPVVTITREEPAEAVDSRIVPMQASEFQCKRCFLVKHRSQLADKKKMLCRDCA